MKRNQILTVFGIIYLMTVGIFMKTYIGTAVGSLNLTAMCLGSSLPALEVVSTEDEGNSQTKTATSKDSSSEKGEEEKAKDSESKEKKTTKSKATGKPQVLIYHTHATESYLPASSGNYHTTKEANTVREAGEILAETLEAKGIAVIHDKSIHDNPSYDASYDRSYETIKEILEENPSITCMIDLHRDAIAGSLDGPTEVVKGKTCASYSYVISNTTDTYDSNKAFLKKLNQTANENFEGYTGKVLERPYWYNQELCGKSILLELGNNRNHIDEVRNAAKTFGLILAETL